MSLLKRLIFCVLLISVTSTPCLAQTTLTFQQGVGGYDGLLDIYTGIGTIEDKNGKVIDTFFFQTLGADVENAFIDGSCDMPTTSGGDTQAWMRFDNILNSIPPGSKVTSAILTVMTSEEPFANSPGPYGVGQLLVPFNEETTYETAESGFTFEAGEANRPLANGFVDMDSGFMVDADVTEIVQNWVNGDSNHGFVISAGTTNGANIFTSSGMLDPLFGPELSITFESPKTPGPTTTIVIEQSASDPTTRMFVADGVLDTFTDADTADPLGVFLDGEPDGDGDPDLQGLFRFDSIFAADGGPVADDAVIVDAKLILTTSSCEFSINSATDDPYAVRAVTSDYDGTGSVAALTFGPEIDSEFGMIQDSEARYDVTSVLQDFQSGTPNFGFNVYITTSTNGWAIIPSSADESAPRLEITVEGKACIPGDVNGDGEVNLLDVQPFVAVITNGEFFCPADVNGDGSVDLLDVGPFVALLSGG